MGLKRLLFLLFTTLPLVGANLHFTLHKMDGKKGDTLLIIGGIHGNEPGSYFTPALFINHYKIISGSVWVVPNLNFDSIIANKRGVYGDMNRKFATIKNDDKDKAIISDIKKLLPTKRQISC